MLFEQYRNKYLQLLISVNKAEVITFAAGCALEDFPSNLPSGLREGLKDVMKELVEFLDSALPNSEVDEIPRCDRKEIAIPTKYEFATILSLWFTIIKAGERPHNIDFQEALYHQQLVMLVAHTEAFWGDSIRAICCAAPGILKSQKRQISWSDALNYSDRESLLSALIENFVSDMTQNKGVKCFLENLKKRLKLHIVVDQHAINAMVTAEQVRHIIVHNGGKIDARFLEKTKIQQAVGEDFKVTVGFMRDVAQASTSIALAVFEAVARKYFSIEDPGESVGIGKKSGQ